MKKLFLLFFIGLSFLISNKLNAQLFKRSQPYKKESKSLFKYRGNASSFSKSKQYITIGGSINALNYFGDLAPKSNLGSTDISFTRPGIGFMGSLRLNAFSSVNFQFMYGRLQGSDFSSANPYGDLSKFRYVRNLHFRNDIKELSANYVFDILPNHGGFVSRVTLTPYVTMGLAVFHHDPRAKVPEYNYIYNHNMESVISGEVVERHPDAGRWVRLKPLGTEGQYIEGSGVKPYSSFQIAIPLGIGVRYKISKQMDLAFEIVYRHLFFDHIDDVGGMYVDLGSFSDTPHGKLARLMSDPSRQPFSHSGVPRDFEAILNTATEHTYIGKDGNPYTTFKGYGHEHESNNRGNSSGNDIYVVTSIKLSYVFGGSFKSLLTK